MIKKDKRRRVRDPDAKIKKDERVAPFDGKGINPLRKTRSMVKKSCFILKESRRKKNKDLGTKWDNQPAPCWNSGYSKAL